MRNLLLMLLLLAPCQAALAGSDFGMTVSPDVDLKQGDAVLNFELKYNGSAPAVITRSSVPGVQDTAIWIAVESFPEYGDNYHPCPRPADKLVIDDGVLGTMTIQPGQSIKQAVSLSGRFTKIREVLGKCDLVVFWSYAPESENGVGERLAGSIVLPALK
ncbi:hypothetical protein [Lysobacter sp. CA196]|uniref:hypothetical protein n=1 Tax=Lysobacter sp. CA196 TaxID=3455606 RepID=UPI003F8D4191